MRDEFSSFGLIWPIIAMAISFCVGAALFARTASRGSSKLMAGFRNWFGVVAVVAGLLILSKLALVAPLSVGPTLDSLRQWVRVADQPTAPQPAAARTSVSDAAIVSSPADTQLSKVGSDAPDWIRQPPQVAGSRKRIVVSSGRFSSAEEAELHGIEQAAIVAAKEFAALDPRGLGTVQPMHAEIVKTGFVQPPFLEVTEHDFGKFKAPMYQQWAQLDLTPELGQRLAQPWRQAAVEARLQGLTRWSVWATGAAGLLAFALRLDAAWSGRRRALVVSTTILAALGSLAFVA